MPPPWHGSKGFPIITYENDLFNVYWALAYLLFNRSLAAILISGWDTPSSKCGWVLTDTASCESNQTDGCKKPASMDILSGGFKHFLNIHPYLGKISILTHIFRRGWLDHQVVLGFSQQTNEYFGTC